MSKSKYRDITREEMSNAIAAYLRGEINSLEYARLTNGADNSCCNTIQIAAYETYKCYSDVDERINASPEEWNFFRRWLAFLQTDHDVIPQQLKLCKVPLWLDIAILLLLAGVFFWLPQLFFVSSWVVCGIIWLVVKKHTERKQRLIMESDPVVRKYREFGPFLSQDDWQAHEFLLEKFNLPVYEPQKYIKRNMFAAKVVLPLMCIALIPAVVVFDAIFEQRREDGGLRCYFRETKEVIFD